MVTSSHSCHIRPTSTTTTTTTRRTRTTTARARSRVHIHRRTPSNTHAHSNTLSRVLSAPCGFIATSSTTTADTVQNTTHLCVRSPTAAAATACPSSTPPSPSSSPAPPTNSDPGKNRARARTIPYFNVSVCVWEYWVYRHVRTCVLEILELCVCVCVCV